MKDAMNASGAEQGRGSAIVAARVLGAVLLSQTGPAFAGDFSERARHVALGIGRTAAALGVAASLFTGSGQVPLSAIPSPTPIVAVQGAGPSGATAAAYPSMQDLQKRFPNAGLPDRLVGTTIDNALVGTGQSPDALMAKVQAMGMNTVRIGAYWDLIQPTQNGPMNWSSLDGLLAAAQSRHIAVILSVGVKAPNWPEYHIPAWAQPSNVLVDPSEDPAFSQRADAFVQLVVQHVKDEPQVVMWQVENEPFNLTGSRPMRLGTDFVSQEIAILRQADGGRRPVLINTAVNTLTRADVAPTFQLADVVGLDVYPVQKSYGAIAVPDVLSRVDAYDSAVAMPAEALRESVETGKPVMVTELQADNWGSYTANPADVADTTHRLMAEGYRNILFWRLDQNVANGSGDPLTPAETALTAEILQAP